MWVFAVRRNSRNLEGRTLYRLEPERGRGGTARRARIRSSLSLSYCKQPTGFYERAQPHLHNRFFCSDAARSVHSHSKQQQQDGLGGEGNGEQSSIGEGRLILSFPWGKLLSSQLRGIQPGVEQHCWLYVPHTHTHTHTHSHTRTHAHTHTHTHTRAHTQTNTPKNTHQHFFRRSHMQICILKRTFVHTHKHTCVTIKHHNRYANTFVRVHTDT